MADRLTDLDHADELGRMKVRLRALSVSAQSALTGNAEVLDGFHQLLIDAADAMRQCAEAFDAERSLRNPAKGGQHG